jgi:hypothetical protein
MGCPCEKDGLGATVTVRADQKISAADSLHSELVQSFAALLDGAKAEDLVSKLEAVVSDAASKAATDAVRMTLIVSVVSAVVTLLGTWWLTSKRRMQ